MWLSVCRISRSPDPDRGGGGREAGSVGSRHRHRKRFVPTSLSSSVPLPCRVPITWNREKCGVRSGLRTNGCLADATTTAGRKTQRKRSRPPVLRRCGIIIANDVIRKWRALPNWADRGRAPSCLWRRRRVCAPHVEQRVYVRGKVGHGTPLVGSRVGPLFWLPRIPKWWSACCSDVDGSVCGTQKTLRIGDCINSGKMWNQFLFLKPD